MSQVDRDTFRIDTPEQAAWVMRKYRRLAQRMEGNKRLAEAEHARIDAWLERVNMSLEGQMDFFEGHLQSYAMQERASGRKSVDLPDGTIKTRQSGARIAYDKDTFVQWALEMDRHDLLRTTYAPDAKAVDAAIVVDNGKVIDPTTGEVIPGTEVTPERVTVSIVPDMDAQDLDDEEDTDE